MANVEFIRDILYQMKLEYGVPATYFVLEKNEFDPKTGLINLIRKDYHLKRLIRLPTNVLRKVIQDIAYLAANKNFTYGADYVENLTVVLLDHRDLARGVVPSINDFIVIDGDRFTIKRVDVPSKNSVYVIGLVSHEGASPFRVEVVSVRHSLTLGQFCEGTL